MNNRIMAALFALTLCLCLFIGVAPVEAEAASCEHVFSAIKQDATTHWYACSKCGEAKDGSGSVHTYDEKDLGNGTHINTCTVCGKTNGTAYNHGNSVTINEDGTHTVKCGYCEYQVTENHKLDANCKCTVCGGEYHTKGTELVTKAGDQYHWYSCTVCKKGLDAAKHDSQWIKTDKDHKKVCACGYVAHGQQDHDFDSAVMNADGKTHTLKCKTCKYEKTEDCSDGTTLNCTCTCNRELEHDFSAWRQHSTKEKHISVCSVCGKYADGAVWTAHKFEAWTSTGWGTHVATCADCDFVIDTNDAKPCNDADKNCVCDQCEAELDHDWKDTTKGHTYVAAEAATCTEEGNIEYKICGVCGQFFNYSGEVLSEDDVVVDAKGHTLTWDDGEFNTTHHQWCTVCGFETSFGDHTFEYTEKGNGIHHLHCTTCGYEGDVYCGDIPDDGKCECICGYKIPHTKGGTKLVAAVNATCLKGGNLAYRVCEKCNGTFEQSASMQMTDTVKAFTEYNVDALGHNWASQELVEGKHVAYCKRGCGIDKRYVAHDDTDGDCKCDIADVNGNVCGELEHSHDLVEVPGVEATCLREGQEKCYKYEGCDTYFADLNKKVKIDAPAVIEKAEHVYGDPLPEGEGHVCKCTVCGTPEGDVEEHVDQWGNNVCDECEAPIGLVAVEKVEATCTAKGKHAYFYSPITQIKYWDEEGTSVATDDELEIAMIAHDTELKLSADGKHHVYDCKNCTYAQNEAHTGKHICTVCFNELNGHDLTEVAAVAAKCDKTGTAAHYKCSCGKLVDLLGAETTADKLVVKALGHKWSDKWTEDNRQGDHYKVCSVCKKENHQDHVLEVQDPMSGNYHQYVCECGEIVTEIHKDGDKDNKCDVCKRSMSNAEVDVKQHDQVTIVTGNPDTTKSFWTVIKNYLFGETPSNAGGSTVSNSAPQAEPTVSNEPTSADVKEDAVKEENKTPDNTGNGADQDAGDNDTDSGNNNETPDASEDASFGNFLSELFTMFMVWLGVK